MFLDPGRFNALLNQMGQTMLWRRASLCPCRDPHSGAAKPNCPLCRARGVLWAAPQEVTAGVTSMRVKREWASFGAWESGDELLSIPSDSPFYDCGEKDRVVMVNSSEPFQDVLTRGGPNEVLRFPVIAFDLVQWIVDGQIVTADTPPTVGVNGDVTWPEAGAPAVGTQYSVRGRKHQEYYMFQEIPRDRAHFHGLPLPRVVQFRRFDLFGRVASD